MSNYDCVNNGYWFSLQQLVNHDKEIRADERAKVIEEFVKTLEKNQTFGDNEFEMGLDFTDVLKVAKQLNEHK